MSLAQPRSARFNLPTSAVVSCQVVERTVIAWTFSTMRLMLFFDGRYPRRAWPVLAEYIRPNEYPRKSNSPSGTLHPLARDPDYHLVEMPSIARPRTNLPQPPCNLRNGGAQPPQLNFQLIAGRTRWQRVTAALRGCLRSLA